MKASKLITLIQSAIEKHGDLDIDLEGENGCYGVGEVDLNRSRLSDGLNVLVIYPA